jgi:hypothetical protein
MKNTLLKLMQMMCMFAVVISSNLHDQPDIPDVLYGLTAAPPEFTLAPTKANQTIWKIDATGQKQNITSTNKLLSQLPSPSLSAEELAFVEQLDYMQSRATPINMHIQNMVAVNQSQLVLLLNYFSCDKLTDKCAGYFELRLMDASTGKLIALLLRVDHHGSKFKEMGCTSPTILRLGMAIFPSPVKQRFAIQYSAVRGCYADVQPLVEIVELDGQSLKKFSILPRISGLGWSPDGTQIAYYQYITSAKESKIGVAYSDVWNLRVSVAEEILVGANIYFPAPIVWTNLKTFAYVWYRFRGDVEPTINWYGTETRETITAQLPAEYNTYMGDPIGLTLYTTGVLGIFSKGILMPINMPPKTSEDEISTLQLNTLSIYPKSGVKIPQYPDHVANLETTPQGCIAAIEMLNITTGIKTNFNISDQLDQTECVVLFHFE